MIRLLPYSMLLIILSVLGGCHAKHLRLTKYNPDEFETTQQPPLEIPEATSLRDPTLGVSRPQYRNAADKVKTILRPSGVVASTPKKLPLVVDSHQAEQQLLRQLGTNRKEANIRQKVDMDRPDDRSTVGQKVKRALAFWKDPPQAGHVIDPKVEQERLEQQGVRTPHPTAQVEDENKGLTSVPPSAL